MPRLVTVLTSGALLGLLRVAPALVSLLLVAAALEAVLQAAPAPLADPVVARLVAQRNANARRVRTLLCDNMALDIRQGWGLIGLSAQLAIVRPDRLRFKGTILGSPALDVGANERECWWWGGKEAMREACVRPRKGASDRVLAPVHPDWLMEVLGLTEWQPWAYTLRRQGDGVELVEKAGRGRSRLRNVAVFERRDGGLQIVGYRLEDARGRVVGRVSVREVRHDRVSGALLPRRLLLEWPAERVKVVARLYEMRINVPLEGERARRLFTPPDSPAAAPGRGR
jgi:hypothetical protein